MNIRTAYGMFSVFFLILFTLAYLKYRSFNTLIDLPIYYQAMCNTLEGRHMFTTIYVAQGYSQLADHWSPILYLFLPLLQLFKTPATLLFIQSLFLALGAVPVYWLAREKFGKAGLFLPAAYLLHPTIWYSNLNDFHLASIGAGIVSFCFYYCYKKEYKKFLFFLLLLFNTKEDFILLGFGFGVYIFLFNKDRGIGAGVSLASLLWFALVMSVIMPYFGQGAFGVENYMDTRYGYLGSSMKEALYTIVFHPITVLKNVITPAKIAYLVSILLPVAFIPLASLDVLLITLPILAENLLSTYMWQYLPTTQYSTVLIPLVYMAALCSVEKIKKRNLISTLFLFSLISNMAYGPPPQGIIWQLDTPFESSYKHISFGISERDKLAEEMIKGIPLNASVAATVNLIPHIPMRTNIYSTSYVDISFLENEADYVFFDTDSYLFRRFDYKAGLLQEVSTSSDFKIAGNESGLIMFEKVR
jgi:uncharacterized membrane protein